MSADGETEVAIEEPEDKKPSKDRPKGKIKYDEDDPNLVEVFVKSEVGRKWLKKIARRVREDFDADFESTTEYRERFAADFRIFAGELPPKEFPYKESANAHLPYMLENLSRLQFRAQAELFGDWKQPFGVLKVGTSAEEAEIVDVLTVHGNWQIREQMPDFRRQIGDRGLLLYFCAGDVTCHSYYDTVRRRNCHEVLTCDDFIAPYVYTTTQPDYSDLPHHTEVFYRYRHELQAMRGTWYDVDKVLKREAPGWDDDPETLLAEAVANVHGVEIPTDSKHAPYKLLRYQGWLPMPPSQQDGSGEERDRFMEVIMDYTTRAIMSLVVYEEPSWQEKERFDRQTQELEQYRQQKIQFDQMQAEVQGQLASFQQQAMTGMMAPEVAQELSAQVQQQAQMMPPPVPPGWLAEQQEEGVDLDLEMVAPMPMRKEPIHLYSHGVCIENLKGSLGLSYGRIQAAYNRAADTSLSQFIDSATMANVWSLITDNVVQFEGGFKIAPGRVNKATGFSGNLKDHIFELKAQPANPQLFDIVRFMQEVGQSSIQAPNVLSGEPGKSGETYRGIAARIEQATKQLTVATQKYGQFVRQVLKNNARLNAAFLPEEEMRYLLDYKMGQLRHIKIERRLYERNYDVVFESDLRYAPQQQKIAEADEVTQMALQPGTPLMGNLAFAYAAIRKSLEARDRQDMVALLGEPPPVPQMFGMPSLPPQMTGMPQQPGAQPQGQQGGETPADGGGMQPPSPGVSSGPTVEHPPGPGGPVNTLQ
jgi:hypothetical protein